MSAPAIPPLDRSPAQESPRTTAVTLKRNAAWAFLGQAVSARCHWGGFIMLGRLAGPEELGRYALALAIANPIILFGGLQMRQLQVADATQHRPFQDYVAVSVAGTTTAGLVLVAIALFGYEWRIALPIMLVGLARGFENLSDVYYGLAQRHIAAFARAIRRRRGACWGFPWTSG